MTEAVYQLVLLILVADDLETQNLMKIQHLGVCMCVLLLRGGAMERGGGHSLHPSS